MAKIKIELSEKQYTALVKVVYPGDWLANSYKLPDDGDKEIDDIVNHIYSYGKGDVTRDLEEILHDKYVDEYDNEIFWDELMQRLAKRDIVNAHSKDEIAKMTGIERITKINEMEGKYNKEFVENGLDNVSVKLK